MKRAYGYVRCWPCNGEGVIFNETHIIRRKPDEPDFWTCKDCGGTGRGEKKTEDSQFEMKLREKGIA